jgi:hypothetical protein
MGQKPARDRGLQRLGHLLIAIVIWAGSITVSARVLAGHPESAALRAAMAALTIVGFLPWIWVVARMILAEDEFSQRIHFYALGFAFALTGVFVVAADVLRRAGFIDYVSLPTILAWMVVTWWLSIVLTARYYR